MDFLYTSYQLDDDKIMEDYVVWLFQLMHSILKHRTPEETTAYVNWHFDSICAAIRENTPDLVALSVTMPQHLLACRIIQKRKQLGLTTLPVSVNVARGDLYQPDLTEVLTGLLNKYELEPSDLHLEILERAYVHDSDNMLHILSELKSQGFYIEVDDFGTGESSLSMGCHLAQGYLYGKPCPAEEFLKGELYP